jgi:molecular chaperone HtpG
MSTEPAPTTAPEALPFQAEVQQLLNILAHSLYTEKEIFLRELVSNASDALHRLQFEMLTDHNVHSAETELAIHIDFDAEARTLTITDTGIGMNRDELIENLGTIAHSGARSFLKQLEAGQQPVDIIGQFGVGFYSVFMVAEEVTVTSRSYRPDDEAWAWRSRGENTYDLFPAEKAERGTTIEIRLLEAAAEFAASWRLESIIRKHSNYIPFPIYIQEKAANQQTALWRQSPQQVDEAAYADFYRQLTLDADKPLLHVHMVADVPVDIHALLFVPRGRETGPLRLRTDHGLKLYTKNVLIQEYNKDLLPNYLRFIEGVVDSEDLPLNISRESIQNDPSVRRIHKALTGRLLKDLQKMGEEQPDDYRLFWESFGPFLKEGLSMDPLSRDDLVPLLRFHSSYGGTDLITLSDYAGRMAEGQEAIYYVLGEDLEALARSPHLDYFKAHDLEVLYLADPLDGFMVQGLREFEGKPLQNVDDAGLTLPPDEKSPEPETRVPDEAYTGLVARFKGVLGDRVADVKESKLLTDSPCRLVSPEAGPDRDMQRIRRLLEEDYELPARILELNRGHSLIHSLAELVQGQPEDPRIDAVIEQLFDNLLLLDGLHPNPARMVPRLQTLLETTLKGGSG